MNVCANLLRTQMFFIRGMYRQIVNIHKIGHCSARKGKVVCMMDGMDTNAVYLFKHTKVSITVDLEAHVEGLVLSVAVFRGGVFGRYLAYEGSDFMSWIAPFMDS